jgi:hypothetical protein
VAVGVGVSADVGVGVGSGVSTIASVWWMPAEITVAVPDMPLTASGGVARSS